MTWVLRGKNKIMIEYLSGQGFEVFQLHELNNGQFYVRLRLNGVIGKFILDTGATHNCVSKNHRNIFKVKPFYESKASGIGPEVQTEISINNIVSIGNVEVKEQTFVILDMEHIRLSLRHTNDVNVNGIIGMDFLSNTRAVVDIDNKKLFLCND